MIILLKDKTLQWILFNNLCEHLAQACSRLYFSAPEDYQTDEQPEVHSCTLSDKVPQRPSMTTSQMFECPCTNSSSFIGRVLLGQFAAIRMHTHWLTQTKRDLFLCYFIIIKEGKLQKIQAFIVCSFLVHPWVRKKY